MKRVLIGVGIGIMLTCLVLAILSTSIPELSRPILLPFTERAADEKASPSDIISQNQIHVLDERVIIDIDNPEWAMFTDTNSMDPVFDAGANAIEIVPKSAEQINAGDIVSYESEYADGVIIHRVVETGYDENGWYARIKGDNNPSIDPGKVRFEQIQRMVVAIVY